MSTRYKLGILFLSLQLMSVLAAQFIPERFFCWAPYDEHTLLQTEVRISDYSLTPKEVAERYRYRMNGWEPRAVHNVFNIVRQFEQTYGRKDSARVSIRYQTNGHPAKIWTYPEIPE